jgi:hypothetical protein
MRVENLPADAFASARELLEPFVGIDLPEPTGWYVLVAVWKRPEKIGSIYTAVKSQNEDEWQGRVGLVLAVGPAAWRDPVKYPEGAWAKPGDWVSWPPVDSAVTRFKYASDDKTKTLTLAFLADDRINSTGVDPIRWAVAG